MKQVLILNYHLLDTPNRKEITDLERLYLMSSDRFREQLKLLAQKKIPLVSLSDLVNDTVKEDFSIAVTFDDGNSTDYPDAVPLLKQYGIPATFFISLHNIERRHITWEQVKEIVNNGFTIGSHGVTHVDLTSMTHEQALHELVWSKQCIEEQLNQVISFFAPPFGRYSDTIIKASKDTGYHALFSTEFALNTAGEAGYIFHRWSVKPNTSMREFEQIISFDKKSLLRKRLLSTVKMQIMKLTGNSFINKLNTFIHSRKNRP